MKVQRFFLVLLLMIGAVVIFFLPAEAAPSDHIKPYGNLYLFLGGNYEESYDSGESKSSDADVIYRIKDDSNLGFNFNYSKYKGVFELGIDDVENDRRVRIRKAFGEYKLSFGELMIGQTWSPYVKWSHEAADYFRSKGFGSMYEDPTLQIKLSFYGFYVDIMKPHVAKRTYTFEQEVNTPTGGTGSVTEYEMVDIDRDVTTGQSLDRIESYIPKFAAGYEFRSKHFDFGVGGAGNVYYLSSAETGVSFNKSWIYSYLAYFNCEAKYNGFSFAMSSGFLVNPTNYGITVQSVGNNTYTGGAAVAIENIATGKYEIKDTWNIQSYVEFGYAFTGSIVGHAGYGFSLVKYANEGSKYDLAMEYYINCKISLGGLIALTPSFSLRDYMKDMEGQKEGMDIQGGILATVSYY